jgi:hypothetical protein
MRALSFRGGRVVPAIGSPAAYAPGMPPRARALVLAAAAALGPLLTGGCSTDDEPRREGDRVTPAEAAVLADLLHRNLQLGGADFVATAPYGQAVLRLTGEIDFSESVGRAEAVTTFASDRADDVRTLFFTADDLWVGDVPALADALAAAGAGQATYLRRPLSATDGGPTDGPPLVDVVARMLLRLAARSADDPQAFLDDGDYTWEGQRSIDSRLASLFGLPLGTVAVGAEDDLMTQYAAPLAQGDVEVTITLTRHGRRSVDLPPDEQTALAADHPGIARDLGI